MQTAHTKPSYICQSRDAIPGILQNCFQLIQTKAKKFTTCDRVLIKLPEKRFPQCQPKLKQKLDLITPESWGTKFSNAGKLFRRAKQNCFCLNFYPEPSFATVVLFVLLFCFCPKLIKSLSTSGGKFYRTKKHDSDDLYHPEEKKSMNPSFKVMFTIN